jgi:hypothetical protein
MKPIDDYGPVEDGGLTDADATDFPPATPAVSSGVWYCECGAGQDYSWQRCNRCSRPRPAPSTPAPSSEAWQQDIDYFANNRVEWDPVYMRAAGLRLIAALSAAEREKDALQEQIQTLREAQQRERDRAQAIISHVLKGGWCPEAIADRIESALAALGADTRVGPAPSSGFPRELAEAADAPDCPEHLRILLRRAAGRVRSYEVEKHGR